MNFINVIYLLLLISLYLCEEDDKIECDEQCQKMVKQREENNKKFSTFYYIFNKIWKKILN